MINTLERQNILITQIYKSPFKAESHGDCGFCKELAKELKDRNLKLSKEKETGITTHHSTNGVDYYCDGSVAKINIKKYIFWEIKIRTYYKCLHFGRKLRKCFSILTSK
jgi:hypothetical protein